MGLPLHEVSPIETPEQIEVYLSLAGVGSRAQAYLIDLLWQTIPILVAVVALRAWFPEHASPFETADDGSLSLDLVFQALVSLGVFAINFGYFAFFETIWQGQTPGKRSMGLRVVRDGGHPLDGRASLLRNFLRLVDFLPGYYVLGMGLATFGRQGKRAGDYAADTLVIREAVKHAPSSVLTAPSPLNADERFMLAALLARRDNLLPEARTHMAHVIAARLAHTLGQPAPTAGEAMAFLTALAATLRVEQVEKDAPHGGG